MGFLSVLLVAVGLAMDAMAVGLGVGTSRHGNNPHTMFRLSFHFGLFQFLMPVIGFAVGVPLQRFFDGLDSWIAFGLLAVVGGRMIRSGLESSKESHPSDPSKGASLVLLSLAVSIDALAVGISLALLNVSILWPAVVIGLVTGGLTLVGLRLGGRLGQTFGKRMEIVGGLILIAIGIRALL